MARPALPVDWQAIRGLYLQGIPAHDIANKFEVNVSTIRSRACREKWNDIVGTSRNAKGIAATVTEKTAGISRDIWAERREVIRERIHLIGDRMTNAAAQLADDQLINKADKIKIATEIAGKSVGLDRDEDKNQVNIAILGAIGSGPGSYDNLPRIIEPTQSDTKSLVYSVEDTDTESVDHHPTHHGHP